MAIQFHPKPGTVLICDFGKGFITPEMVKRRPAVVISPQIQGRPGLCTIAPLSTAVPFTVMPYHVELTDLVLPAPFDQGPNWVKADMVFAASFSRLDLFRDGWTDAGRRNYLSVTLSTEDFASVRRAVLHGMGFSSLTKHL